MPASAVTDDVVSVALEGNVRVMFLHPFIEYIMQKQVRKQWTDDRPLRSAFSRFHSRAIRQPHRHRQPSFDVEQHPRTVGVFAYRSHHEFMIDVIEKSLDVEIKHPVVTPAPQARYC